jgi:hypothetical protein
MDNPVALEMKHRSPLGPAGQPEGPRLPHTLRGRGGGALETERISLRELSEGNLEEGLLYWELKLP